MCTHKEENKKGGLAWKQWSRTRSFPFGFDGSSGLFSFYKDDNCFFLSAFFVKKHVLHIFTWNELTLNVNVSKRDVSYISKKLILTSKKFTLYLFSKDVIFVSLQNCNWSNVISNLRVLNFLEIAHINFILFETIIIKSA